MGVKFDFLKDHINEEVHVSQHMGFEDRDNPYCLFKLKRALYGPKQAHGAWCARFSEFLIKQ